MAAEPEFDEFYNASFKRVVGQVYAMVGSLTEAEDSVQEAFARAWQNWSRISAYEDPEAWVRGAAFRLSVSAWRKAVNRFSAYQRQANQDGEALSGLNPDRAAVVAAVRKLKPDLRQVIVLHHLLDRSVEEISRETGVPSGTVKARLVRGRKELAPHLSEFADPTAVPGTGPKPGAARTAKKSDGKPTHDHDESPKGGVHYV